MNHYLEELRGFPDDSDSKESAYKAGDPGSILGLGRSPGEGNGNPLQCSCLGNPMDRGNWWAMIQGVAKSQTQLNIHTVKRPSQLQQSSASVSVKGRSQYLTQMRIMKKKRTLKMPDIVLFNNYYFSSTTTVQFIVFKVQIKQTDIIPISLSHLSMTFSQRP